MALVYAIVRSVGIPIIVFAFAMGVTWLVTAANGKSFLSPATWAHWDSFHYTNIAHHGYTAFPCGPREGGPSKLCGNSAWFPGYPLLIRLGTLTEMSFETAGFVISQLFFLALLVLVWVTFLERRLSAPSVAVLTLAAFWFGEVYYHALFPIAPAAFFVLLSLWLCLRSRYLLGGLAGAAAALMYSTGIVLVPVLTVWIIFTGRREGILTVVKRLAVTCSPILGTYAVVAITMRLQTGLWFPWATIEEKYGHHLSDPVAEFVRAISPLWLHSTAVYWWTAVEALAVALVMGIVIVVGVTRLHQKLPSDGLLILTAGMFWVVPLLVAGERSFVGYSALYRSDALMIPAAIVLRTLPVAFIAIVAAVAAVIGMGLTSVFLHNLLV